MPTDTEAIKVILVEIRDQLQAQDAEALKRSVKKLSESSTPTDVMNLLAPFLFRGGQSTSSNPGDFRFSNDDALSILGCLVSANGALYLKPASKAVRDEAVCLGNSDQPMTLSPSLLDVMVSQLSGSDIQVSTNATEAIVACCRKLGSAFGDPVLKAISVAWRAAWNAVSTKRSEMSTICVRCASAIVDVVCLDDSMMKSAKSCGDINLLLTMLTDESDPLLEMSSLDLIERLATTLPMHYERAHWLFSNDIVIPLLQMAGGMEGEGLPDPILGGTALRVVAALCKQGHRDRSLFDSGGNQLISGFHRALHNFNVSGEVDRMAIIDAISSFASASPDALERVLSDPVTRNAWLSLSVAQPKLKSVVLFSVSMVLDPSDEVDSKGDFIPAPPPSNTVGLKLFETWGQVNEDDPSSLALSLAKSPLPETRLGAYALLKAVAKLPTGCQVLLSSPGLYEFLVSREVEKTKEGREAKYAIVEVIAESPAKGLLADDIVAQIEKYVKEGPHYVKPMQWELATD